MKTPTTRLWLLLSAFSLQAFSLFNSALHAQNPTFTSTVTMGASQFRTSIPGGVCYTPLDSGTCYTTPGSWYFSGTTFTNTGASAQTEAAVYVQGNGNTAPESAVFTGSNLTILASGASGYGRRAMVVTAGGAATLIDSIIRQDNAAAATGVSYALYVQDSQFTGTGLTIGAVGPQTHAIYVGNSALNRLIFDHTLIQNSGSAAAYWHQASAISLLTSCTINTTGAVAPGFLGGGGLSRFTLDGGLIHTTGANSPGLWLGSGNTTSIQGSAVTKFTGALHNALVQADAGMGIEINTDLPGLISRPELTNLPPTAAGYYDLTVVSSTISGALGAARMTSSSTLGVLVAEIPTIVRFDLTNSLLEGDVFANDGVKFHLISASSRLDGALRLSGAAPTAAVTLDNSAITGGIVLSGGATLDLDANATTITGTLAAAGNSHAKIRLTGGSTIGGIALDDLATLELTLDNTSSILGDFSIRGGATYTLLPADNNSLVFSKPLTLATGGNLRVAPGTNLTLTSPLTFADPAAMVTLADVRGDDLVLSAGLIGTGRLAINNIHVDVLGQPEIRVIRDDTGALDPNAFTLASIATNRLFAYHGLENRPDGAYLTDGGFSPAGAAILNTPALVAVDFFEAFSPVSRHLAGLRESGSMGVRTRHADGDSGAFWLSARTGDISVGEDIPGLAFRQQTYALATGADLRWGGGPDKPAVTAGLFADTSYTRNDFTGDADGRAITFGGGLYALYQRPGAWHASLALRMEKTNHNIDVRDMASALSADHTARSFGATLAFGWFLPGFSPTGWWAEPSVEAGVARLGGASYDTRSATPANNFHVGQDSSTAAHARAQIAFGRDLYKQWAFRARFAGSYLNISGGDTTGGGVTKANFLLDGFRAEATLGLVRHLGPNSRLWLDCDTALATNYKRPWTLSLGFAKAW